MVCEINCVVKMLGILVDISFKELPQGGCPRTTRVNVSFCLRAVEKEIPAQCAGTRE